MQQQGFTLLEILLVVAAIGILAAIVIVAINPNRQLAQARDAERQNEVNTLYKSLEQYLIDNNSYPSSITNVLQDVCRDGQSGGCIDLETDLVPTYLASIPEDPQATGAGSGYYVAINPINNKVVVQSLRTEINNKIQVNSEAFPIHVSMSMDFAYSLRKISLQYDGPVIQVRRDSDNATQDIGINNLGLLDDDALQTFVGAGNGYITTWYDQSGNGNNATQGTPARQPQIVTSGSIITSDGEYAILFDGVDDHLFSGAAVSAGERGVTTVANMTSAAVDSELYGMGRNAANPGSYGLRPERVTGWDDNTSNTQISRPLASGQEVFSAIFSNDQTELVLNNTLVNTDSRLFTNFTQGMTIGGRIGTSFNSNSYLQELYAHSEDIREYRESFHANIIDAYQIN
jgi:prepilin-type N-terminal cleavage/methylation domain-containing protein